MVVNDFFCYHSFYGLNTGFHAAGGDYVSLRYRGICVCLIVAFVNYDG
jgi:hypothetical protein